MFRIDQSFSRADGVTVMHQSSWQNQRVWGEEPQESIRGAIELGRLYDT